MSFAHIAHMRVKMEKKKLIQLLGSIFIAVIFLSSYAIGMLSTSNSSNASKPKNVELVYATAHASVVFQNFSDVLSISTFCNSTKNSEIINSSLNALEANGSVATFYPVSQTTQLVDAGNESTYAIFQYLSKRVNMSCTRFKSSAIALLPSSLSFTVPGSAVSVPVAIPASMRRVSIPVNMTSSMSLKANVTIAAMLTSNATIYNMTVVSID